MARYAYERAEKLLDAYALQQLSRDNEAFFRAWRKFRAVLVLYAFMDFDPGLPIEDRMAWSWEDASMAFRGYGENLITGAILQLWDETPEAEHERFHRTLTAALDGAESETPLAVRRRYDKTHRTRPVRKGSDDFLLPSILPSWGPRMREWHRSQGLDAFEVEEQLALLEEHERRLLAQQAAAPRSKGRLRLLKGGKESGE